MRLVHLVRVLALTLPILLATPVFAQNSVGKKYALLIGVSDYEHDRLPRLQYTSNDIAELAPLLNQAGYEIILLTDARGKENGAQQPSKANIERAIRDLLKGCRKTDTVLIALAGHGLQFTGNKDAYFCPSDAKPFAEEAGTLLSLTWLYNELDRSLAGMRVLLVDACRDDPAAARSARGIDADNAPRPPQGVAALFSCRAGERAFESGKLKHGVFFHHILEGLQGKARTIDNEITFASLASYVSRRVPDAVQKLIDPEARQSPNLKADYAVEPVLRTLPAEAAPPVAKTKGVFHALLVGVSDYSRSEPRLPPLGCVQDVHYFTRLLKQQKGDLYRFARVQTVLDEEATRTGIMTALEELARETQPEDTILVMLSARGLTEKIIYEQKKEAPPSTSSPHGSWFFFTSNFQLHKHEQTALGSREVLNLLHRIPGRKVLLLDCCHSGAMVDDYQAQLRSTGSSGNGLMVLASCRADQQCGEIQAGSPLLRDCPVTGFFSRGMSQVLTAGFAAADRDGDGKLDPVEFMQASAVQAEMARREASPNFQQKAHGWVPSNQRGRPLFVQPKASR